MSAGNVRDDREKTGILLINKHSGATSHDIVAEVRRIYGIKKVGHTGTLDPLATGLLVVLAGRAVKASEYALTADKRYTALLKLGITTSTEDSAGEILTRSDSVPGYEEVKKACEAFRGEILQTPPMYSAIKVNGTKLVDLARKGTEIERASRKITIYSLECFPTDEKSEYILDVKCSKGTYIRTLCADIGKMLGCGGMTAKLERTEVGDFSLSDATTIDEIKKKSEEEREKLLLPTEILFKSLDRVVLDPFREKLFRSGCEIRQKDIRVSFAAGTMLRICDEKGHFFALGKAGESGIKSAKLFELK